MKKKFLSIAVVICIVIFFTLNCFEKYSQFSFLFIGMAFIILLLPVFKKKLVKKNEVNEILSKRQKNITVIIAVILFIVSFLIFLINGLRQ